MRLVWTLVLQLSYLTMAIPSVTQEGESILEPPRERFERSISEQEERVKELLDNFKAEMLGKFQEQDRRIAAQQKTIEEQNETIQMILTHLDLLQDSGPSSEAEAGLLLITGGSGSRSSVEVYPSTSSCSPPDLPAPRTKHTTFLTAGPNPVIATCGGEDGIYYTTASCLVLDKINHRWDESRMGDLTRPRRNAAAATLDSVGVFIIGGDAGNNAGNSNFLAAGQMQWQAGPALPRHVDMDSPCVVTITPTKFLAIYGDHILEFDAAIAGPTSMDGWRYAGRLKTSRKRWPGCAKIGQKVIVAGGYNNGEVLRSTEVLDLDSRQITAGEDMASPRHWFHLATIRRGGEEKVFAVNGWAGSTFVNTVEELVEEEESTTWATADSFLGERRGVFGALALPEEFLCPA